MKALLLAALALVPARAAAEIVVTAELNREWIELDEQAVLSVTVAGDVASLPSPRLPAIDGLSVYESGRSQSMSFVNGQMAASVVHTYVLAPRRPGKFKIPPITAGAAARPSAELTLEVIKEGAPRAGVAAPQGTRPQADQPETRSRGGRRDAVFATAWLDKKRAYVNEQVTLSVRFHSAIPLTGQLRYDPPDVTGFLSEELPPVREGTTVVDGQSYRFTEVKLALFPVQPGRLKIGSAQIHGEALSAADPFSGDIFERFFQMNMSRPFSLRTDPLELEVAALPEGKPAGFTGVVGRLSASAALDRAEAKTGDAVTLTIALTGSGNVKSAPDPLRPDIPALRFFDTESSAAVTKAGDRVGGAKTYRLVMVPRVSGELRLPPFEFPYFDPERREYARAATPALTLKVAPGPASSPAPSGAPASPAAPGVTAIASDIRYLKSAPERSPVSAALGSFAALGPWHGLPLAALLLSAGLAWRRRAEEADPRGRRARAALSVSRKRLREAAGLPLGQAKRASALIDEALVGYAADKLGVPAGGLTLKTALDGLKALPKPPSAPTLARLKEAWEEADLRRFAPVAAGGAAEFARAIEALLEDLDKELGR